MAASFLLVFREVLEAALVVGVILGYLLKTGRRSMSRWVWIGVGAGIAGSVAGAILFNRLAGGFEGRAEQIFEAVTRLAGAALLTTAIAWLARAAGRTDVERAVASRLAGPARGGLALLAGVSVLREGIELVIFLAAARVGTVGGDLVGVLVGALAGFAAAIALGVLVFTAAVRVNLRSFFTATNVLLVLFAAGLVAGSLHEFAEAGVLPSIVEHLWVVNLPALQEDGAIGGILKGLFGWSSAPSALEVIGWAAYLAAAAAAAAVALVRRLSAGTSPRG